ncbi:MAG: dihydrolipoyl dehydrogenase [Saprospiraceae bacterium]|jgi:dihydrolipoamide dehydrogenase|uniref:dihydrolipoyl dehydrogenase n=1 Tax=Candidatus Brachybacter algidus TaxID=2982024 RepID=UPI001B6986F7|nr:dihydrolipoyl dehydrogenase [Candidatus Brachybacter algidus]MBP7304858.1 dihydrolipoyl dehydrogenase [Saprospiraceae bacterium]MBK6447977.1 dihydrolipoyl dehydrogenase [Candidatus Brachybacter algidus]MBK8354550.1 dihydrolipoyl dehydrogenase [Candidatus Brachybacter algidus]MBK8750076.1 dihydrolipoyl dehydrogenase [Candidatus Brachybacter algidus]MBK9024697.1 dihydrolipoyl dehydrogenase [Candidatus Brachybacter algidus]
MKYDVLVLGSGPGGYVAAIRASQLGLKTAVIERESLGGICLNWGCIPTKALLKSAKVFEYLNHASDFGITVEGGKADFGAVIKRSRGVADGMSKGIQFLFKKNKIDAIMGNGILKKDKKIEVTAADGTKTTYEADHIIIATGARSKELPGIAIDKKNIIGYREAMSLPTMPESMVVIGAGAIGVEFAYFYHTMGTKVTVVEFMENGLVPREDAEISKELNKIYKKKGMTILGNTAVEKVDISGTKKKVTVKDRKTGESQVIECDVVLSATGVTPNLENIGLEEVGISIEKGFIKVDEFYNTSVKGYYAIGDVLPTQALAHLASAEGITCVEKIAGQHVQPIDYGNVPGCTYCSPEVASVGYTEVAAKEAGYELKIGKFPFAASGKAAAGGVKDGFVKLIFDAKYGELLGAHFIGDNVTEMIAEIVVARKLETTGHEMIKSIHPHPTMSEAIMEAAAAAYGEVIHI